MSGTRVSAAERRERAISQNRERSLANLKPWQPGQSGNPGGRPKGMAAAVREEIAQRGGEEVIVRRLLQELDRTDLKPLEVVAICKELSDRGYGKAPAFAAIEGQDPLELSAIAQEVQAIADQLAARRESRGAPVGAPDVSAAASG